MGRRRYVDEQAIWTVMRFDDEPEERPGRHGGEPPETFNVPSNVPTDPRSESRRPTVGSLRDKKTPPERGFSESG